MNLIRSVLRNATATYTSIPSIACWSGVQVVQIYLRDTNLKIPTSLGMSVYTAAAVSLCMYQRKKRVTYIPIGMCIGIWQSSHSTY